MYLICLCNYSLLCVHCVLCQCLCVYVCVPSCSDKIKIKVLAIVNYFVDPLPYFLHNRDACISTYLHQTAYFGITHTHRIKMTEH